MRKRAITVISVRASALGMVLAAGCAPHSSAVGPLARCSGPLNVPLKVTVSGGAAPVISWAPACGVNRLSVLEIRDPRYAGSPQPSTVGGWGISSADGVFWPPVHFGELPIGAVADGGPTPLQPGRAYAASAWIVAPDDSTIVAAGSVVFKR